MSEKEKIKQYLDFKGISQNSFYKNTGLSIGFLNSGVSLGADKVKIIINTYPDISIEWLVMDKGEMLRSERDECSSTPVAITTAQPKEGIPLIPISAMAGALSGGVNVLEYECERYIIPMFKGAEFMINVKGSSMYPKYNSGDIVACKRVAMQDLFFQWNKVYVIDTNQGALIKRIKKGSTPDSVLIVSDNEKYEPFELPLSAIYNVALVVGVVRLE